ncbi:MAG: DUF1016 family protein [Kiritimatiellae bacterium]|nr:DUF1016 family protein [Kiritimatiellia bacterium]
MTPRPSSPLPLLDPAYAEWVRDVARRFRAAQIKAAVRVNAELIRFYWSIGRDIVEKRAEAKWGDGFFQNFSRDLQRELPGVKGLSPKNLYYTKSFYLLYSQAITNFPQVVGKIHSHLISPQKSASSESFPQVVGKMEPPPPDWLFQIPWGHHRTIIDKHPNSPETALFYLLETFRNGWSRSVLSHHLDLRLHERQGQAVTNFAKTLPDLDSDLARELTKDPYAFDFTQLTEAFTEKELKAALVANIEKFLLELGNGFAFMGREHRLDVAGTELFTDLLFYHVHLHCYVVVEVKTEPFEPAFLGQLSGYVSSANHLLKGPGDNDTIGLLICKSKNRVLARYALEGYNQPLGISDFELAKLYPCDFRSSLPSIEEIEASLSTPPPGVAP